eukprot:TRINITY_DN1788_c0_g1_i3.p1 TRINITY_DN1788_c0_g1~~TRINITY_DN1788_c0_g1_i3.p1  ORF type:complete len:284 (+),score=83.94 TRINITY_DN1788_c0_g1_i3:88-939(+)
MFAKIALFALLFASVAAQDSIFITVNAVGTSENVRVVGQAVSEAVTRISGTCGADRQLVAQTQAKKVVEAAVEATAAGRIQILSTGNATGNAATSVTAVSNATVVAEAIATAIAAVGNGPAVQANITALKQVSKIATAEINQAVAVSGDAKLLAEAVARSKVFVKAVAEALSAAAAGCVNGTGVTQVAVQANASEAPAPAPIRSTFVNASLDVGTGGFANIFNNSAFARTFGGSLPPLSTPATPPETSVIPLPSPANAVPVTDVAPLNAVFSSLTGFISALRN